VVDIESEAGTAMSRGGAARPRAGNGARVAVTGIALIESLSAETDVDSLLITGLATATLGATTASGAATGLSGGTSMLVSVGPSSKE